MDIRDNRLYSQLEIILLCKLPPTTVKRWLTYFGDYVFSVQQNDFTAYSFETVTLMMRIDELRNQKYHLRTIRRILHEEGFPVKEGREMTEEKGETQKTERTLEGGAVSESQQNQVLSQSLRIVAEGLSQIAYQLEELCTKE